MTSKELRAIREATGVPAHVFAHYLGVAKSTYYRWERGRTPITRITEIAVRVVEHNLAKEAKGPRNA